MCVNEKCIALSILGMSLTAKFRGKHRQGYFLKYGVGAKSRGVEISTIWNKKKKF